MSMMSKILGATAAFALSAGAALAEPALIFDLGGKFDKSFNLGIGMFFLERFGFSAAPLVLGLILGPIAEANFIQGGMIADATVGKASYFLTGTLNLFLIAVVLASVAYSVWMELRHRRYTTKEEAQA